ncbi:hypothetical protein N658DRAFT_562821 [Parathielavia hyrcaniae]|uniref:Cyclin n=1 Tax=Parathielavia hyrcaniae TaxID=113614 RepID=A0AAN6SWE9_9PEZI|nr:hypothetical protein N658DRAFT_562821 [Parathielavia hyrcaniae]
MVLDKPSVRGEGVKRHHAGRKGAYQLETQQQQRLQQAPSASVEKDADKDTVMRDRVDEEDEDNTSDSTETDSELADSTDGDEGSDGGAAAQAGRKAAAAPGSAPAAGAGAAARQATYFVVDSFNIHRLIIAGVTCASKFFSDVFYTNSRYAKAGGLPLPELNHLELQFLLLNDFRLAVPVEDLEAYATMLVEFYTREVLAQRSRPGAGE